MQAMAHCGWVWYNYSTGRLMRSFACMHITDPLLLSQSLPTPAASALAAAIRSLAKAWRKGEVG